MDIEKRAEMVATAKGVRIADTEPGWRLKGEILHVDVAIDLGGYKGVTPVVYMLSHDDGKPVKMFLFPTVLRNGFIEAAPQIGDVITIVRGDDAESGDGVMYSTWVLMRESDEETPSVDWDRMVHLDERQKGLH